MATGARKKKVLFLICPSFYFVTGYRQKSHTHKFLSSGAFFLASALDPEVYDVDLYELDSMLMKKFDQFEEHIDDCPELFHPEMLAKYLNGTDGHDNPWLRSVVEKLTEGMEGYDYILASNIRNPTFEIPVRAGNYFNLLMFRELTKKNPGAERIVGGTRTQYLEDESLRICGIDIKDFFDLLVFQKISFMSLVDILEKKELSGTTFEDFGRGYKRVPEVTKRATPPLDFSMPRKVLRNPEDLRYSYEEIFSSLRLPMPEGDLQGKYIQQMELHYIGGCIARCAFCSTGSSLMKLDDTDEFIEKMKVLIYEHGFNSFFFVNATLNSNKPMVEKICNWIVRENIKIMWSDSCRLSGNSADFYKMIYEAGARMLCFGADSGSDRILKYINKGATVEVMQRELEYSHNAGIWNLANFIGGYPFETPEDLDATLDFLAKNIDKINIFKFNIFHMEHSSPFFRYPARYNLDIPAAAETDMIQVREPLAVGEPVFHEIGGRTYSEFNQFRKLVRQKRSSTRALRVDQFRTHIGQHLLFALYGIFGEKAKVEDWLDHNFRVGRNAYYKEHASRQKIEKWDSEYLLAENFPDHLYKPLFPATSFISGTLDGN